MVDLLRMKVFSCGLLLLSACLRLDFPQIDPSTTTEAGLDLGGLGPPWADVGAGAHPPPPSTTSGSPAGPSDGGPAGSSSDSGQPPTPPLPPLRITEILSDPDGKDGGPDAPEYVELLNAGRVAADLDGLVVRALSWPVLDATALGLTGRTLAPDAILVVERYAAAVDVPPPRDQGAAMFAGFSSGSGLRNADGAVGVEDGTGAWADVAIYGSLQSAPFDDPHAWGPSAAETPAGGHALCRIDPAVDTNTAEDWAPCPPSPGVAEVLPPPPPPPNAQLVILEVLSNAPGPATEEKTLEFIEILNLGPDAVDLTGFTVADDLDANAPGIDPLAHLSGEGGCGAIPPCLAPGRRAILVGSDYMGPTGGGLVMTVDDTTLADAGLGSTEPVIVRNREGEIQSTYRVWLDASAEPNPASVEQSLVRIDAQAPDEPASWTFATPTPGE